MKRLLFICLGLMITFSYAQDGSPDLSFGDNGIIVYDIEGSYHEVKDVDESFDGKIFALYFTIGGSSSQSNRVFAFNHDGSIDATFGDNGIVLLDSEYSYTAIDILANQKLLIQSLENTHYTLTRLMADGTLDASFGNNGKLQPLIIDGVGKSAIIDQNNDILVIGVNTFSEPKLLFYKFFEDGQPDSTFGNNGIVEYSLGNVSNLNITKIMPTGNGIYIGIDYNENDNDVKTIYKFLFDGSLDSSFGTNGKMIIPIDPEYNLTFSVFQDGSILVGGSYQDATYEVNRKTIKLNSEGEIDEDFGDDGIISGFTISYIQENQSFISDASLKDWEMGVTLVFSRFYPDGTYDNSFEFSSNYYPTVGPYKIQRLQSGKFLIVGSEVWYSGSEIEIALQRFNNNPLSVLDNKKNMITVYPNPSHGIFQIYNTFLFENDTYGIFDSAGKQVLSGQFSVSFPFFDLSNLNRGVYFLKMANSSQTLKLIKK